MKQIILTITLLLPAMAYGKLRPYLPAYFNLSTKQVVVKAQDGKTKRVFPMSEGVSEAIQLRAADISVGMETCEGACYINVSELVKKADENPGGALDVTLESLKFANLKGEDSELVKEIIFNVSDMKGPGKKPAALIYAASLSRHWTETDGALDTTARDKIVELSQAWSEASQHDDGITVFATAVVFNEGSDAATDRENAIEENCLPEAA